MKEYNVLEAYDLCMNGNPVTINRIDDIISERFNEYFIQALCDNILKRSHKPIGILNVTEPIITDQPIIFTETKANVTFGDLKKALIGESLLSKSWKWLKYWFRPSEPDKNKCDHCSKEAIPGRSHNMCKYHWNDYYEFRNRNENT